MRRQTPHRQPRLIPALLFPAPLEDKPLLAEPDPQRQRAVEREVRGDREGRRALDVRELDFLDVVEVEDVEGDGDGGVAEGEADVGDGVGGGEAGGAGERGAGRGGGGGEVEREVVVEGCFELWSGWVSCCCGEVDGWWYRRRSRGGFWVGWTWWVMLLLLCVDGRFGSGLLSSIRSESLSLAEKSCIGPCAAVVEGQLAGDDRGTFRVSLIFVAVEAASFDTAAIRRTEYSRWRSRWIRASSGIQRFCRLRMHYSTGQFALTVHLAGGSCCPSQWSWYAKSTPMSTSFT